MDQRSMEFPGFTPFGTVFQPIGEINGRKIWPVLGGADDDGDNGSGGSGGDNDAGGNGNDGAGDGSGSNDDAGSGSESGESSDGDGSGEKTYTAAEYAALEKRMKAADRAKSEAQKKVDEHEAKNRSELDNAKLELEKAAKERDEARDALRSVALKEAFREASDNHKPPLSWHNTAVALGQLDKDLYEIGEDGTITGIDKAVKALAKDHEYLLKKAQTSEGGRTGGAFNDGSGGGGVTTDRNKLAGKYPALRGRGGK